MISTLCNTTNEVSPYFPLINLSLPSLPFAQTNAQYLVHSRRYPTATKDLTTHTLDIDLNRPLWKRAQRGDRVLIMAKAKYPGWINKVQSVFFSGFLLGGINSNIGVNWEALGFLSLFPQESLINDLLFLISI